MYKTIFIILFMALDGLTTRTNGQAEQNNPVWPKSSSYITIYASSFIVVANTLNLAFENIWHLGFFHPGFSAGLTLLYMPHEPSVALGGHATISLFTGKKINHFDLKIGFSYTPKKLLSGDPYLNYTPKFWPVLTLGYRFEKPDKRRNFRTGLGTGGFGLGTGWRIR